MFVQQGATVLASGAGHVMSGFSSLLFVILALGMVLGGLTLQSTNLRAGRIFVGSGCAVCVFVITLLLTDAVGL